MSRTSVRVGVATLLAAVVDGNGNPYFKAVYPVMPTRIDKALFPAAFVMLPKEVRHRRGPQQKHLNYTCAAMIGYSAPSVGWQTPASGVLWTAPADDPQVLFDAWLDAFCGELEANKTFPQDANPGSGVVPILIGEPDIEVVPSDPEKDGETVILWAIVSFPAKEQLLGV